jgi:hypothetical protein
MTLFGEAVMRRLRHVHEAWDASATVHLNSWDNVRQ